MSDQHARRDRWFPIAALTACWALLHTLVLVGSGVIHGELVGTDPYMRLVRVSELIHGGGWFDSVIDRSNAPFGDELHWTRPLDLLLVALAAPSVPFIGVDDALLVAGVVMSPLLHLATVFVVIWAARPVFGVERARLAAIVALVQPAIFLQVLPGQADHHALQLLALALELGLLVRLLDSRSPTRPRIAFAAGAVAGFGVLISPEMTILAGLSVAALGFAWARGLVAAVALRHFALAMLGLVAAALVIERPPDDWLTVEYDRVSLAHLATAAAALLVSLAFEWIEARRATLPGRAVLALPAAALAGVGLLLAFPGLIEGPASGLDPRLDPVWFDHVAELRPLFPSDVETLGRLLFLVGPALITLPFALVRVWKTRGEARQIAWLTLTIFSIVYLAFALRYLRFAPFAGVLLAIVSGDLLGSLRDWTRTIRVDLVRRIAWAAAAPAFVAGFMLVGAAILAAARDGRDSAAVAACDLRATAAAINQQPGSSDAVVYTFIDYSPELLYRTDAAYVAGPYHRNGQGILDVHDFFSSTDIEDSEVLARARQTNYVLVCDTPNEEGFYDAGEPGQSLYERLVSDDPPEWLSLVARGSDAERFRLYEVRGER